MTKGERIKQLLGERCNAVEIGLALRMPSATVRRYIRNGCHWCKKRESVDLPALRPAGEKRSPAAPSGHRVVSW